MGISGAIVMGALSAYQSNQQMQAQKSAQKKAEQAAARQEQEAQREFRRQNQKQPDLAALLGANRDGAAGGVGSTMLTGPQGVNPNTLSLGKSSLLGQ